MRTLFIGGYLRTGTTLLQTLLCASPDTNPMVREVVFLRGLLENAGRSLVLYDEHLVDYFDSRDELARYCAAQIGDFLARTSRRWGDPNTLVLKHPQLTPYFPLLSVLLPKSRFVVMMRDPRDVAASAMRAARRGAEEFAGRSPPSIALAMRNTTNVCLDEKSERFQRSVRFVRYEDLVRRPREVLDELSRFAEIDLSGFQPESAPAQGRIDWSSEQQRRRPLHSDLYGAGPSERPIGRYAEVLTPAAVAEIEGICGEMMRQFKYPFAERPG